MKKAFIGLAIVILLAVGARAFWAFQQALKQRNGEIIAPQSVTLQPGCTSALGFSLTTGQPCNGETAAVTTSPVPSTQTVPPQVAKPTVTPEPPIKQPTTSTAAGSAQQAKLLSYRVNQGGGYDAYIVAGVGLSKVVRILLGNLDSNGVGHLVQETIEKKTQNEIIFYVGESDINAIKEKRYVWMCGVYDMESITCDTNRLPLTQ